MFSIAPMPRTSLAPMPPTPMQATLSLSLGATWRRPRTCEGTMVKAAVVEATSPTKVRRSIGLSLGITVSIRGSGGEYFRSPSPATAVVTLPARRGDQPTRPPRPPRSPPTTQRSEATPDDDGIAAMLAVHRIGELRRRLEIARVHLDADHLANVDVAEINERLAIDIDHR